ncbi:MAG TPA: hypothetical protein VMV08_09935 [Gaiellaceae bacterium]|nr:hypothetical protein [Gaiellaceae bacterium]
MRPLARIVALIRADVPLREIVPLRTRGGDAYEMIEQAAPASWERLAAWTAFMLQIYADNLVAATESTGYVPADTAVIVRQLYELVRVWLERAKQLRASPTIILQFQLPNPLPRWPTSQRSNQELAAMRDTLEAARARVAADLKAYAGPAADRSHLSNRMVAVESSLETVELLWVGRGSDDLRLAIGTALCEGLEQVNELGQLLAQPALLARLHG